MGKMEQANISSAHEAARPATISNDSTQPLSMYYPDYSQMEQLRLIFVVAYVLLIVAAVFGNVLVIITVARHKKMHNSLNFLTCNLAVSDLLVGAFVAPAKLIELTGSSRLQIFGSALYTCLQFTQSMTIFSTIVTLLLVATERYLVIVFPLRLRRFKKSRRTRLFLLASWLSALLFSTPNLVPAQEFQLHLHSAWGQLDRAGCADGYDAVHPSFRQSYFCFLAVMLWLLPSVAISYASWRVRQVLFAQEYTKRLLEEAGCSGVGDQLLGQRSKSGRSLQALQCRVANRKKVAVMMLIVNVTFLMCWSPYFMVTIVTQFGPNFFTYGHFYFTMLMINGCAFLNSALNPLIYMLAPRFRYSCCQTAWQLCTCLGNVSAGPDHSAFEYSNSLETSWECPTSVGQSPNCSLERSRLTIPNGNLSLRSEKGSCATLTPVGSLRSSRSVSFRSSPARRLAVHTHSQTLKRRMNGTVHNGSRTRRLQQRLACSVPGGINVDVRVGISIRADWKAVEVYS